MSQDKTKTERTIHYRHLYAHELRRTMRYIKSIEGADGKHRAHKVSRLWVGEEASGGELTPPTFEGEQPRRIVIMGSTRITLKGGKGWPDLGARRFLDGAGEPETLNTRTEFTRD